MFENVVKIFPHFEEKYAFLFVSEGKGWKQVFLSFKVRPRTVEDMLNPENWNFTDSSITFYEDINKAITFFKRRSI